MNVENKNILVVGFARSGLAAANFLLRRGARLTITDVKSPEQLQEQISRLEGPARLALGGHPLEEFLAADFIVLSPGVPARLPQLQEAKRRGVPVYSEVEVAYRFLKGKIIGVTGSNGKTTTSVLIGEIFKNAGRECVVAGNIGSPLMQCAEKSCASPAITFVVELSSFQLETIERFKCDIALALNVTPDHLDRYQGFEDYLGAKERIFFNQTSQDYAVLNADNPHTLEMSKGRRACVVLFSRKQRLRQGVFVEDDEIRIVHQSEKQSLMPVRQIRVPGNHNLENVLAAAAAGFLSGIDRKIMADTFRTFAGVEHRLELVREINGVAFYNDSKATNVDSTAYAVEAFRQPIILIMGGRDKGADFATLRPPVKKKVKLLVLIGEAAEKITAAVGKAVPATGARDLEEAVKIAYEKAVPGDVVLLSPGCASFDMFENFEHRGRVFKEAVNRL